MAAKRKRSTVAEKSAVNGVDATPAVPPPVTKVPTRGRRAVAAATPAQDSKDPNKNADIIDGVQAMRASPDEAIVPGEVAPKPVVKKTKQKAPQVKLEDDDVDALAAEDDMNSEEPDEDVHEAARRPPAVNSSYLPLPWKGRLGYACLNTYLRSSNPPVFCSRTCRIASILDHRHPLKDPSQPEHATKNRPDKEQPASVARGQAYVEAIGLANTRDLPKMIRWNEKYGIKFMRLSSEMFPFASHEVYGYKLAPFAAEALAEAGKVIAQFGHRVSTHPGQFTQLGSPRKQVIESAIRDLEFHDEMLSLLKLPPQQDRDAVMILHMGGAFGDKPAALDRFRENYARLSPSIKRRLVLENDDVVWCVHEFLPVCQELNIPMVLDYHHHNILFDKDKTREGTLDIMNYYDEIKATWTRKGITQKMHYSEQTPPAITPMKRRKHSPRVATLPPCADDMDLMIEAKDKEQAVFELMKTFKLPGHDLFNNIVPHQRADENKPIRPVKKKATPKKSKSKADPDGIKDEEEEQAIEPVIVPDEEIGMGGPERRVYWPPGMEEWLRPPKRVIQPKVEKVEAKETKASPAKKRKLVSSAAVPLPAVNNTTKPPTKAPKRAPAKTRKRTLTPSTSTEDGSEPELSGGESVASIQDVPAAPPKLQSRRSGRASKVSYAEVGESE